MLLERNMVYQGNLILVNRKYPLKRFSRKRELCPVFAGQPQIHMERESAQMLKMLLDEVESCNNESRQERRNEKEGAVQAHLSIVGVSGYRSKEEQTKIFEDSLEENGRKFTETYVAFPDHSEHQTGLAIDLAQNKPEIDFICPEFPYEGVCQKFREKMADFGFVERYPKEKQEVTGIGAEPWHFRYVGAPHARLMQKRGMVLEEYVEWLKQFDFERNPLILCREDLSSSTPESVCVAESIQGGMADMEIRIGYVKAQGDYTKIEYMNIQEKRMGTDYVREGKEGRKAEGRTDSVVSISGNNVDGFILTCTTGKRPAAAERKIGN